jgi:hypothetical protein
MMYSKAGDELLSECFLRQEMLSAILLSIALIHSELMPRGKLINNEQKKGASICPIFHRLHMWSVLDRAEEFWGEVEDYRMGIVCDRRCPNNIKSGAIINYHHHKFKNVDQHKHAIIVVGLKL